MIVLDASVAVKAYLEESGSDEATAVISGRERLLAPELIRVEVAGAICRRVRKGELESEDARKRCDHWLVSLSKGLIELTPDRDLVSDAIILATELKHPIQDCIYLAAARRLDVPLITADKSFRDRTADFDNRVTLLIGCGAN
jgi:predicted nucleic acid-binding protein